MTSTAPAVSAVDASVLLTDGRHLIGGEWAASRSGETIDVINPATQETLLRVPRGGADDVDDAVRAAAEAFPAWRDTSPSERAALLYRWAGLCLRARTTRSTSWSGWRSACRAGDRLPSRAR